MAQRWRAMAQRWRAMARQWNALQCSDSDSDGSDGTTIAIAQRWRTWWRAMVQRWRAMAQRWNNDGTAIAMAQQWNSNSEGSDNDGGDSDGAPIERWRSDGTNVAMAVMVQALRWRSDGQRCDESDDDCQRCDGQASATAAMGDKAFRRDGDELSPSMAMVHGERWRWR
ncbi:hypothetical protein CBR_g37428 [Chara braunii]|uniref:Uncharacterized protein n=1 Tax=Chara braunii TaxID=69332 RepID=A0A388LMV0_CHABU|nr:hypothetical protein CBR_g37428 [Chara braunii]|eukprot:GBG83624.1 hypothetical protein CBR_g37428 [Chara braunii]